MRIEVKPVEFPSRRGLCRGRHFAPAETSLTNRRGAPCVVLGHGFGGTIEARLTAFAECYARAGCHALAFDYRHFGASDGEPRQLLSIRRQIQDWHAAIAHARFMEGVDPHRVALMGTSFSGGHVVRVAAEDGEVAAVIAQCPMMDGLIALLNVADYAGWGYLVRIAGYGLRDLLVRW
jgi:dienelactone hydrolase